MDIRDLMIPYGRQCIEEDDIVAVSDALRSDFLTTGPLVEAFEKSICEVTGAKYAVAVSNGTTALHAAVYAAGIKPGDEVITTPLTFAATANAILYCGGIPVFADIIFETGQIDPKEVEKAITKKTKAIIAVDYAGNCCDYLLLKKIALDHGLVLIEDAAHSIGSKYDNTNVGNICDMTTFSFHPVKTITTGEGGAVTTNNLEYYELIKRFRHHGITRDKDKLTLDEGSWYYEQMELGNNYRLTDIQCALGISQLKKLDRFSQVRNEIVDYYHKRLDDIKGLRCIETTALCEPTWHLFPIILSLDELDVDRRIVFEALRNANIGVNVHYLPVYLHPYYKQIGYQSGICQLAEKFYQSELSLPLYPLLTSEEQKYVVDCLIELLMKYLKKD